MDCELCDHGDDGEAHEACPVCFIDECAADRAMSLAAAGRIDDADFEMTYDSALFGLAQCSFVYWKLLNMKVSRKVRIQCYCWAREAGLTHTETLEAMAEAMAQVVETLGPELTRAREYALASHEAMMYRHAGQLN